MTHADPVSFPSGSAAASALHPADFSAELLDVDTVAAYLATRPEVAQLIDASTVTAREIGDGNLNLVFVATDAQGRSLILKQALPYVRGDHSWAVPQHRFRAEARGAQVASRIAPATSPVFYGVDHERGVVLFEDLSSWRVWRGSLNDGVISRGAGAALGRFIARLSFATSVFGRDANEVHVDAASVIVPELTRITEDLIFTEPFLDHEHNSWDPEIEPQVMALREPEVYDAIAPLKYAFMTHAEALIHGDLHTGSVFVPGPDTPASDDPDAAAKAFDFEFSFFGPVGFDIGALYANYLVSAARAVVLDRPAEFTEWVLGLPAETWGAFEAEYRRLWPGRADASLTDGFLEHWLARTRSEAIGFGGLKAVRRIVGWSKASDIATLPHDERISAASTALRIAREWITRHDELGLDELLVAVRTAAVAPSAADAAR